jgi:hypothetical protein
MVMGHLISYSLQVIIQSQDSERGKESERSGWTRQQESGLKYDYAREESG